MAEEMQSCRSEEGITVGLVDCVIGAVWALTSKNYDLSTPNVQEALRDLFESPELQKLRDALKA